MASSKNPTTPALDIPKPPVRRTKGEPPQSAADTAAVGNNTTMASDTKLVDLGFKVLPEFRKNYRMFCSANDLAQVDAFKEAMADYMKKKGWSE